jgi:DNA-binding CsgD family transcriptional regulator
VLCAARGAAVEAREAALKARDGAHRHGLLVVAESASFALGAVELAAGNPEEALVELESAAEIAESSGRVQPAMCLWPADRIESLVAVGRRDDALAELNLLDNQAEQTKGRWARGVVARCRGLLADDDAFDPPFETAVAFHRESAMPFDLARSRLSYGQRLRRAGRRVDARQQIRRALRGFEELQSEVWRARAERELAGTGERLRRGDFHDRDALTPQELQVARLVAAGATNQEAAADLFLSAKTIETHLTRIYRKLGVRSRSQLAQRLAAEPASALG